MVDAFQARPTETTALFRLKVLMDPTDRRLVDDVLTVSTVGRCRCRCRLTLGTLWLEAVD